jgi:hypothetical protein
MRLAMRPYKYNHRSRIEEFEALYNNFEYLFDPTFYGFEIGPGWFEIIADFIIKTDRHVSSYPDKFADFRIFQVKEKFGGLRIYVHDQDHYLNSVIAQAEREAYLACTICGNSVYTTLGFGAQMCEEHFNMF